MKSVHLNNLVELVPRVLDRMGKYQIFIIVLLSFNSAIVAINHTVTSFHIYTPTFHCSSNKTFECSLTKDDCISGYNFDGTTTTIVTEWNLICQRRLLAPMVNTLYFCGVTLGAIVCGILADLYGRKKIIVGCLFCQCFLGLSFYLVTNFEFFVVLRTIQGFFVQGLQGATFTLILELCSVKYRTIFGVYWDIIWALGLCILGGLSYIIPDWRNLQLALSIPSLIAVVYIWLIPESIYWLLATGDVKNTQRGVIKIARYNKDNEITEFFQNIQLPNVQRNENEDLLENRKNSGIFEMFKNKILRKHVGIMCGLWFSISLSYYGIVFYLPNVSENNRHENFLIGAGSEVISYILSYFALEKIGRKIPLIFFQFANGIICIAIGFITIYVSKDDMEISLIYLTLIAKGLAVASFCAMFIYASELFPTVCRGAAFGVCGFFARVGSLLAPLLLILSETISPVVPMWTMGILIILTGIATYFLPETSGKILPNTIEESDITFKNK